jgi:flagellar basal-body rod protein FlgC
MDALKSTLQQAVSGMELQSRRLVVTSENISNVDTPGYRKKMLVPESGPAEPGEFRRAVLVLDDTEGETTFDPSHPMADADGYITSSNVSLVVEMADMREANRTYEANLNSFQQARSMYRSLLDILRR